MKTLFFIAGILDQVVIIYFWYNGFWELFEGNTLTACLLIITGTLWQISTQLIKEDDSHDN